MKFDSSRDIDQNVLDSRALKESKSIHKSASAQGRTFEQIYKTSKYGLAAEVYLIQHAGFRDNPEKYQDVIDPKGMRVEVKVTSKLSYVPLVLAKCASAKRSAYRNHPDVVYVFTCPERDTIYQLNGIFRWNGNEFIRT